MANINVLADMIDGEIIGDTIRRGHFIIECTLTGRVVLSSNVNPDFRVSLGSMRDDSEFLAHTFEMMQIIWRD